MLLKVTNIKKLIMNNINKKMISEKTRGGIGHLK